MSISVTVQEGGLKSFLVQDDGHGIRVEDMTILCERHTTSKLASFEDLRSIGTFGFRGEALASISHVAHVTVTSMTATQPCAYRASYQAGELEENHPPKACAGNQGTIIQADNLFFNLKQRREALHATEEMKKIINVVQRYALHYSGRALLLKKLGSNSPEIFTQKGASIESNIVALYGAELGPQNLLSVTHHDQALGLDVEAHFSSINYGGKRPIFVLFINHRLVESASLKKMAREVYANLLGKGKHSFVYLSLMMKPENVDVNVHPTKSQVRFRFEDEILSCVERLLDAELKRANVSRPFQVASQAKLSDSISVLNYADRVLQKNPSYDSDPKWRTVRVDSRAQKMDTFLVPASSQQPMMNNSQRGSSAASSSQFQPSAASAGFAARPKRRKTSLASIQQLLDELQGAECFHEGLSELFRDHTFVGCIDANRCAIQHRLILFVVQIPEISRHFFYEQILDGFEDFEPMRLNPPASVTQLLRLFLSDGIQTKVHFESLPPAEQSDLLGKLTGLLTPKRREMMRTYLSLDINDSLELCSLPIVVANYMPDFTQLPRFVYQLCSKVNYKNEKMCFENLCRVLAEFFSPSELDPALLGPSAMPEDQEERATRAWSIENVLFNSFKQGSYHVPRLCSNNGAVVQIASVDGLYKCFERC